MHLEIVCDKQVAPGATLHCTVTYTNLSNFVVKNAELVTIFPDPLILNTQARTTLQDNRVAAEEVQAVLGDLAVGQSDDVSFTFEVPERMPEGDITITAVIRGDNVQGLQEEVTQTASVLVAPFRAYLPTVFGTAQRQVEQEPVEPEPVEQGTPDLVGTISLGQDPATLSSGTPVEITVEITNQGTAAVVPGFWVDLSINPAGIPQINQSWDTLCGIWPCQGIAWQVHQTIEPGESITLTATPDSYSDEQTIWNGTFVEGTTDLYLYVDSWNPDTSTGAVQEGDGESNNLFHLGGLQVAGDTP
jgi:hypothetical protein